MGRKRVVQSRGEGPDAEFVNLFKLAGMAPGMINVQFDLWIEKILGVVPRLKAGLFGGGPLVANRLINELLQSLRDALSGGPRAIAVRGGMGIGKTAAAYYAAKLLIEELGRSGRKALVVDVDDVEGRRDVEAFAAESARLGYAVVFYLDASTLASYPASGQPYYNSRLTLRGLLALAARIAGVARGRRGVAVLAVLTRDQYGLVEELLGGIPGGVRAVDADAVLEEEREGFLREVVRAYCKCPAEVAERVAAAVSSRFAEGYTVAAAYVGRRVREGVAVEYAVGEAERFLLALALDRIWREVLERDARMAERAARALLAVGLLGGRGLELVRAGRPAEREAVSAWLSSLVADSLPYSALRWAAREAVYRRFGVGRGAQGAPCSNGAEGWCAVVKAMETALDALPAKRYGSVEEVAEEYARLYET